MRVWIDGVLTDESNARVSVFDHALTTGDGVFETVKVVSGRPFALTRHLSRLARSARAMALPEPDTGQLLGGIGELLSGDHADPVLPAERLRITVTGGVSPPGSQRGEAGPTLILTRAPMTAAAPACDVVLAPWARNEYGALAGVKSTSYAENVLALAHARSEGGEEAIFGNTAGNLCEGTGTNVFCVHRGRVTTPPLSAGCLAGVSRELVLEWFGGKEENLPLEALAEADEAFLTSTTRDVQPIRAVGGRHLPAAPGPLTRKAMDVFARRSGEDDDP